MVGPVWTIVVAAGSGRRFGGWKQFEALGDRRVVDWSVGAARAVSDGVVVVVPPGAPSGEGAVVGGPTRSDSVRAGLRAVPPDAAIVVVHDAARPFARPELFESVIERVRRGADGAVPGLPLTDTVKEVDDCGRVLRTPDRRYLVAVQTPQAFSAEALRAAHANAVDATDDATVVEVAGGTVVVVPGDAGNRKLTQPDDLAWARDRASTGEVVPCG